MRWVVELPADSGGTAATVTVDGESWKAALSAARSGKALPKFRCDFEDDGTIRVHDLVTNQRFALRPMGAGTANPAPSPRTPASPPASGPATLPGAPPVSAQPDASAAATSAPAASVAPVTPAAAIAPSPPVAAVMAPAVPSVSPAPAVTPAAAQVTIFASAAAPATAPNPSPAAELAPPAPARDAPVQFSEPAASARVIVAPSLFSAATGTGSVAAPPRSAIAPAASVAAVASAPDSRTAAVPASSSASSALPVAAVASVIVAEMEVAIPSPATLLFQRNREFTPSTPLTFRERVLAMPKGTHANEAERVARQLCSDLRVQLAAMTPGQYVSIAVFDHEFRSRPERAPLVVLNWKDWRGNDPEVTFPAAPPPVVTALPVAAQPVAAQVTQQPAQVAAPPAAPSPSPSLQASMPPAHSPSLAAPMPLVTPGAAVLPAVAGSSPAVMVSAQKTETEAGSTVEFGSTMDRVLTASSPAPASPVVLATAAQVLSPAPIEQFGATQIAAPVASGAAAVSNQQLGPMMGVPPHTPGTSQRPPQAPAIAPSSAPANVPPQNFAGPVPMSTMTGNAFSGAAPVTAIPVAAVAPVQPVVSPQPPVAQMQPQVQASQPPVAHAQPQVQASQPPVAQAQQPANTAPVNMQPSGAAPGIVANPPRPAAGGTGRNRAVSSAPRAEELLADAFEATQDLAFLHEPDEACAFVSNLARDLLKSLCVAVSVYDIDKDELELRTCEGSPGSVAALGRRAPLKQGPRGQAALRSTVVTLAAPPTDEALLTGVPGGPVLYVAARHDRRLFGVLELHRAPGAAAFNTDEEHTALYIATQLGQFLADHSKRVGFKEDRGANRR